MAKGTRKQLVEAARAGDAARVEALIAEGVKGTGKQLVEAARAGETAVVAALIRSGAKGASKQLVEAASAGESAVVEALLRSGVDLQRVFQGLMREAAPDSNAVKALVAAGADPNAGAGKKTLLHKAAVRPLPDVANLVAAGASVHAITDTGERPLHFAAHNPFPGVVEALLAGGADPNARDGYGRTPLHGVVRTGGGPRFDEARKNKPKAVAALIAAGGDPNARDDNGRTPLFERLAYAPAVAALVAAGGDPNARTEGGDTVLHNFARFAINGKHANARESVKALLKGGANPNATNHMGETPLHVLLYQLQGVMEKGYARRDDTDAKTAICGELIEGGANLDARDRYGDTPREIIHSSRYLTVEGMAAPSLMARLFKPVPERERRRQSKRAPKAKEANGCMVTLAALGAGAGSFGAALWALLSLA